MMPDSHTTQAHSISPTRLIIEQRLDSSTSSVAPEDFKCLVFHGKVLYVQRFSGRHVDPPLTCDVMWPNGTNTGEWYKPYPNSGWQAPWVSGEDYGKHADAEHCEALGVGRGANNDELKRAFRRRSLAACPEYACDEAVIEKLQRAYEALSTGNDLQIAWRRMLQYAALLVPRAIHFVRVDFFLIGDQAYFGEFTTMPGAGLSEMSPMLAASMGQAWELPFGDAVDDSSVAFLGDATTPKLLSSIYFAH